MDTPCAAVIDLGSNSFKLLVARSAHVDCVFEAYEDVRLLEKRDAGIISAEKFSQGIDAVKRLLDKAQKYEPTAIAIVGTSVFRTAANAREFAEAISEATGTPLRVLSGEEEAEGIAAGVLTDSLVRDLPRVPAIFDLGGGSLEFIGRGGNDVRSWPLGAVRVMDEFVREPKAALQPEIIRKIRRHVRECPASELSVNISRETPIVFCGGVLALAHHILARKSGIESALFPRKIPISSLEKLLADSAKKTVAERVAFDGVPATRADIFPVALAIVLEVADVCGVGELIFSPRNLRYGIAAKLLN